MGNLTHQHVYVASDHAGYACKEHIKGYLAKLGIQSVKDLGASADTPSDYPNYAHHLMREMALLSTSAVGLLFCGTGNGMAMVANKYKGSRAALCWTPHIASLARRHNHANVLCLPARFLNKKEAEAIVKAFLEGTPQGERHARRVAHIDPTE